MPEVLRLCVLSQDLTVFGPLERPVQVIRLYLTIVRYLNPLELRLELVGVEGVDGASPKTNFSHLPGEVPEFSSKCGMYVSCGWWDEWQKWREELNAENT